MALFDGDSNVFHKAILGEDGSILTIAAEKAMLKKWTHKDGKWSHELLWEKTFLSTRVLNKLMLKYSEGASLVMTNLPLPGREAGQRGGEREWW